MFTAFRNASIGYERKTVDAMRGLSKKIFAPNYKAESIEFMTKKHMRNGLTEEQARSAAEHDYYNSWLHDVVQLSTFGLILPATWYLWQHIPYLTMGSNQDEKDKQVSDDMIHACFGPIEGLTGGDLISDGLSSLISNGSLADGAFDKSMPIASDISGALEKFGYDKIAAVNDLINVVVSSGIGINPQTISDGVVAIWDKCGNDAPTAQEAAIMWSRIAQVPQSQLDKVYFDELDCTAEQARKLTPMQVAERYAAYKVMKGAGAMALAYPKSLEEKRMASYEKKATDELKSRMSNLWSAEINEAYDKAEEKAKSFSKTYKDADDDTRDMLADSGDYEQMQAYKYGKQVFTKLTNAYLKAKTPKEAEHYRQMLISFKPELVKLITAKTEAQRDKCYDKVAEYEDNLETD
jgi:hypothetical protein